VIRVAVDAMGGDHAPDAVVAGALRAVREDPELEVVLVGRPERLDGLASGGGRISVEPAGDAIAEGAPPARSLARHPDAAVAVAMRLAAAGRADAAVSCGNTGAALVSAVHEVGLVPGVVRCAVGEALLGWAPRSLLIDLGPSVDVRPAHLVAFAHLGAAYHRAMWGTGAPSVAILSNGGEAGKGNAQVKEALPLLAASGLRFIGPIEGHDLAKGAADVVVCDGFVGNVLVKFCEGLADVLEGWWTEEGRGAPPARPLWSQFRVIEERGAPLLGVRRVVVLGHGRAGADQVAGVVRHAARLVRSDFLRLVGDAMADLQARAAVGAEA
jgi:glycerol-3-phosphate acyltransferase PlsX